MADAIREGYAQPDGLTSAGLSAGKIRRQRRGEATLRAYLKTGSAAKAAELLGITESTVRQTLSTYYAKVGVANAAQAAYLLDRPPGWKLPEQVET